MYTHFSGEKAYRKAYNVKHTSQSLFPVLSLMRRHLPQISVISALPKKSSHFDEAWFSDKLRLPKLKHFMSRILRHRVIYSYPWHGSHAQWTNHVVTTPVTSYCTMMQKNTTIFVAYFPKQDFVAYFQKQDFVASHPERDFVASYQVWPCHVPQRTILNINWRKTTRVPSPVHPSTTRNSDGSTCPPETVVASPIHQKQ